MYTPYGVPRSSLYILRTAHSPLEGQLVWYDAGVEAEPLRLIVGWQEGGGVGKARYDESQAEFVVVLGS